LPFGLYVSLFFSLSLSLLSKLSFCSIYASRKENHITSLSFELVVTNKRTIFFFFLKRQLPKAKMIIKEGNYRCPLMDKYFLVSWKIKFDLKSLFKFYRWTYIQIKEDISLFKKIKIKKYQFIIYEEKRMTMWTSCQNW